MKKWFKKIHLWLSIPVGLPITIICLTGAILAFAKDFMRISEPHLYSVEYTAQSVVLPHDKLILSIEEQLSEEFKVSKITEGKTPSEPYTAMVKEGKQMWRVNQYTGEVLGELKKPKFLVIVTMLHRWFLDVPQVGGVNIGKYIVIVSTIFMLFILISGLIIWIPKTKQALKPRLSIEHKKGLPRVLHDMHVSLGFYTTLLLIIMCVTGLIIAFEWYGGWATKESIQALHTGSWGGIITKSLYCITALIGATLPITGYYLWLKKKSKRK